jgi:hypothetical protein
VRYRGHDCGVKATGIGSGRNPTHRNAVITAGLLLGVAVIALVTLWPRTGSPGFTGVAVTVPGCPPDVEGCRLFVTNDSDGSVAAHRDWSGGPLAVSMVLQPGGYTVWAEGCTADSLEGTVITVTSGNHAVIDLGNFWQLPAFVGRTCPGFLANASP